ncbi:FG-GAP-like repeat-containing protein [Dyadobacter luticola]|uniref:T9SS type A sorting domain-containing protein n=1 Tax=Dyadobacter luticola TaxID=1979387 RepID=A0A5R9L3G3_9BACT|nr:FG-GAP-like repeat-containing protein [Dyadobacter luticola]TLV03106.1 T9SS type A sorting domain-containing protein [Dyadobacter luticola]
MKHTYKSGSLLLLAMVIVGLLYQFADHPWKTQNKPGKLESDSGKPDIPQNTVSQLQEGLEKREYHISFDEQKQSLQSPNRKQNLRAYYKPGKLSIHNRVDSSGQNFQLHLTTAGVYANGQKLYAPEQTAEVSNHENQLDIHSRGFTEQYINSKYGVRQNFIIDKAPDVTESLEVRLAADGLKVRDQQDNELYFYSENKDGKKITRLIYNDLKCWDSHGKALDATLAYQNERIVIKVDVASAMFPVTIDPIITNGNPGNANTTLESNQAGANAGRSVSSAGDVNGDGYSDVIIGAPLYDKGETNEGAVFVHYGSANGISVNPAMILEGNQAEAQFGGKAALAGDVNKDGYGDIIVGASYYDKGQANEGAAFIYHGSANGLSANPAMVLESNQAEARFGISVNLAGDVNADGFSDVVVSAVLYDKGQTNEGAAFVYHGSATGINPNAATTLESNQAEARMGYTASSAGDVNGDGYSDIIVGVYLYDKGEVDEGTALIYHGSALGVSPNVATILESNQATSYFGAFVSFAGDVNGDGYGDVVVGAYLYDNEQTNEGAAFVYLGSAAGLNVNSKKQLEINQSNAQFGYSVNSAGDVNGDGYADIIIGANLYDKGETDEGGAFIFQGSANGISANAASTLESNQTNAQMGWAVASAGDVNGDGYSDVVVGAHLYDKGQADEGAAFVWMGGVTSSPNLVINIFESHQKGARMGSSVAIAGDINGDGYSDLIAGAYNYDNGQINEGAVFIVYGSSLGPNFSLVTVLDIDQSDSSFGVSVSSAGDVNGDGYGDIIVGAPRFSNSETGEGAAFIYYGSSSGINSNSYTKIEGDQVGASAGYSVSNAGDINSDGYGDVLVGVTNYTNGQINEGGVIIVYGSSAGADLGSIEILEANQTNALMGTAVSSGGDVNGDGYNDILIVSDYYSANDIGAVLLYYGSALGIKKEPTLIEQSSGQFTDGISSAGDVNGDGFDDIVVGLPFNLDDMGNLSTAKIKLYYGSALGVDLGAPTILSTDQAYNQMGYSVSHAGDLNSDGYADIVVGAYADDAVPQSNPVNSQTDEGAFYIYYGSTLGLNYQNVFKVQGKMAGAFLGSDVSGGGDVDGDGYSDLIIGASGYSNGQYAEGAAYIYYGNKNGILQNNLRLYNSDLATPINHNQFPPNNFGAGLFTKSFLGGNKGKLVWETKPKGQGFSKGADNVITHSTQSSGSQNVYASLGLSGAELKNVIAKQGAATKVRARVKYDPVLALTGQTYGPWRYLPSYLSGGGVGPVPEEKTAETVRVKTLKNDPVMIYPNPVSDRLTVRSSESSPVANLQLFSALGREVRSSQAGETEMSVTDLVGGTYILVVSHMDGTQSSHKILIKK